MKPRSWAAALLLTAFLQSLRAEPQEAAPEFDRVVAPLLAKRCLDCHSGSKPKGKLDLSRRASAARVVVAGDPARSLLWEQLDQDEMPPKKPLPAAEKKPAPWNGSPSSMVVR